MFRARHEAVILGLDCTPIDTMFPFADLADLAAETRTPRPVELVLVEIASSWRAPEIVDISGHGWLEVDEPHERDHAESVLAERRWWA